MTTAQLAAMRKYVRAMRNDRKRAYGERYVTWLVAGSPDDDEPDRGELSYMGAQAVRLGCAAILRDEAP